MPAPSVRYYYINLAHAKERREESERQAAAIGLDLERIEAVYGKDLQPDDLKHYDHSRRSAGFVSDLTPNEHACILSHLKALRQFLGSGAEYGVILEDDFSLPPDFRQGMDWLLQRTNGWEALKLYMEKSKVAPMHAATGGKWSIVFPKKFPWGSVAILYTRKGAQAALEGFDRYWMGFDVQLAEILFTRKVPSGSIHPPLVMTNDPQNLHSTIDADQPRRNAYQQDRKGKTLMQYIRHRLAVWKMAWGKTKMRRLLSRSLRVYPPVPEPGAYSHYTIAALESHASKYLLPYLSERYGIRILPEERFMEADFLVCDTFLQTHRRFKGVKILLTGENHPVDLNHFDYCLTHEFRESDRCHRFPYWQQVLLFPYLKNPAILDRPPLSAEELKSQERQFCAFVCRNAACRRRNRFVRRLSERRRVDCGGPYMNNIGYKVPDKVEFQKKHLFSIAYENEASPGYQTEKIIDAYLARSIPIYWGNPKVEEEFRPDSFIHAAHFRSEKEMIDHIIRLSGDPQRMAGILNAPIFQDPNVLAKAESALGAFFEGIFSRGPGAIRRTRWQKCKAFLSNFYGHGLFFSLRRLSRKLRGK